MSALTSEQLTQLRHHLHRHPELSSAEFQTAEFIAQQLKALHPSELHQQLAETGIAAVFDSGQPGPSLLFRCELDALPIEELNDFAHRSCVAGVSHKCGHDGHMAIMLGLASKIAAQRPTRGRAIVLFQPAEETGEGARAVVADPKFSQISADACYALHNVPGYPMGEVLVRSGTFNCASRGMTIRFSGKTAHAAHPETGISPAPALAELLQQLPNIGESIASDELVMATIVHTSMGEMAFGTAPADGCLMVTLRSETNSAMQRLVERCTALAEQLAERHQLSLSIDWADIFEASVNHPQSVEQVVQAAEATGHSVTMMEQPFRWSEDFGALSATAKGAMFGFGAGCESPQIHNPDYDFPDQLISRGQDIFFHIYQRALTDK